MKKIIPLILMLMLVYTGIYCDETEEIEEIEELPDLSPDDLIEDEDNKSDYSSFQGTFSSNTSVTINREVPYDIDSIPIEMRDFDNYEDLFLQFTINPSRYVKAFLSAKTTFYPYIFSEDLQSSFFDLSLINAYIQLLLNDGFYLTLGIKQIDWGLAYVWSALGMLNRLNSPLSLEKENPGTLALNIELFNRFINYTFVLAFPETELVWFDTENADIMYSHLANRFMFHFYDTSIILISYVSFDFDEARENIVTDFSVSGGINQELLGFIFYVDTGVFYDDTTFFDITGMPYSKKDWSLMASFGCNKNIFTHGFIIFEYNYNSKGYSREEMENFNTALQNNISLALPFYSPGNMGTHHFYIHYNHTMKELVDIGVDVIVSLSEPGGSSDKEMLPSEYVSAAITYLGFNNTEIALFGNLLSRHDKNDIGEFSYIPYWSTIGLELKIWF